MTYVFVVVGAHLSLQQGQQVIQTGSEFLPLDLHKQPTNLSAESLKTGLGSEDSYFRPEHKLVNPWIVHARNSNNLLCVQPCVDELEQRVLMVRVQLSQERLDGQGGHLLTTRRGIIDHDQGQGGEEEAAVLQQQILRRDTETRVRGVSKCFFADRNFIPAWSDFLTCGKVWKM